MQRPSALPAHPDRSAQAVASLLARRSLSSFPPSPILPVPYLVTSLLSYFFFLVTLASATPLQSISYFTTRCTCKIPCLPQPAGHNALKEPANMPRSNLQRSFVPAFPPAESRFPKWNYNQSNSPLLPSPIPRPRLRGPLLPALNVVAPAKRMAVVAASTPIRPQACATVTST
jgi:hypothetical protein